MVILEICNDDQRGMQLYDYGCWFDNYYLIMENYPIVYIQSIEWENEPPWEEERYVIADCIDMKDKNGLPFDSLLRVCMGFLNWAKYS